ncbi:MAG: hypothetical protein E7370_02845 [Clostridiales bacterium]|nr:hypothetical protein [Clostridiales bacterium]
MQKEIYYIGCTGHIKLNRINNFNENAVRQSVKNAFSIIQKNYNAVLLCGLAYGADTLFAEEAIKCGVKVIAVLPCSNQEFAKEQLDGGEKFNNLIKCAHSKVEVINDSKYLGVSKYIVDNSCHLFALWDNKAIPLKDENGKDINKGGTYDTIQYAKSKNKKITLF